MTAVNPPAIGRELVNPPADGISNLRFSNHSDHLLVSSWDKVCRKTLALFIKMLGCRSSIRCCGLLRFVRVFGCMMRVPMCCEESSCTGALYWIVASMTIRRGSVPASTILSGGKTHSSHNLLLGCSGLFLNASNGVSGYFLYLKLRMLKFYDESSIKSLVENTFFGIHKIYKYFSPKFLYGMVSNLSSLDIIAGSWLIICHLVQ